MLGGGHRDSPGYSRPPAPASWRVSIWVKAVLEGKQRQTNASTAGQSVGEELGIAMGGSPSFGRESHPKNSPS